MTEAWIQYLQRAADEIERLAKELLIEKGALEICQGELNMAFDKIEQLTERVRQLEKTVEASGRM
jgi:predicted transcriptional regulator